MRMLDHASRNAITKLQRRPIRTAIMLKTSMPKNAPTCCTTTRGR